MKKLLSVVLMASMVLGMTACSSGSSTASTATSEATPASEASTSAEAASEASTPAPSGDKVTVTLWDSYTDAQNDYLEKAIADFNASQNQYEVVRESQARDGLSEKIYNAVMAGNGPDLCIDYASTAAQYVADGKVANLEEYLTADTLSYLPDSMQNEAYFDDGHMHLMPVTTSGPVFFYNKAVYDELGLTAPATWEELQKNCEAIKEAKPDMAGFAFDSTTDGAMIFIMQTGNKLFDGKETLFNTPEVATALQYYADGIANGLFTDAKVGNYYSEDFNAQILASYIGSSAGAPYLEIEYGVAPVPQGGSVEWTPAWTRGLIVFNYDDEERVKAAAAFTDYFASPEVNAGWCEACVYTASSAATRETEAYKAFIGSNEVLACLHPEYAGAFPASTTYTHTRSAMETLMSQIGGGTDVQTALDEAQQYVADELAAE